MYPPDVLYFGREIDEFFFRDGGFIEFIDVKTVCHELFVFLGGRMQGLDEGFLGCC